MNNLRIVLDTNVFLVSLAPNFKLHWIFQSLIRGKYDLFVTTEILLEYEEIISKRYGLTQTDSTLDFLLLLPNVNLVTPYYNWNLIEKDVDDNKFVDCAVASNADYLISNDKDYNILKEIEFPKVEVLKAEEFTDRYREEIENN